MKKTEQCQPTLVIKQRQARPVPAKIFALHATAVVVMSPGNAKTAAAPVR
jgi:hypothetical protein